MRRMVPWAMASALGALLACTASSALTASTQEEVLLLEVAADQVPCVGEMSGSCIQVRSPGEEAWLTFYDPIEGFQHEPGVRYTLEVGRRTIANPPADGSSYAYRLIRVVDRDPPAG